MWGYFYFVLASLMTFISFYMLQHRHTTFIRASGIVLAYIAAAIAVKAYYLLTG